MEQQSDAINPPHYQGKGMQVIDVIEAFDLNPHEANIIKYVLRWRKKEGVRDLNKAKWYLERLIKNYEQTGYSAFYSSNNVPINAAGDFSPSFFDVSTR